MKKLIITISLIIGFMIGAYCQTGELKPVTKTQTEQSLTKTATKTGQIYKTLPVYKSSRGKLFVIKHSKNGNYYKLYLQ